MHNFWIWIKNFRMSTRHSHNHLTVINRIRRTSLFKYLHPKARTCTWWTMRSILTKRMWVAGRLIRIMMLQWGQIVHLACNLAGCSPTFSCSLMMAAKTVFQIVIGISLACLGRQVSTTTNKILKNYTNTMVMCTWLWTI